MQKTCAIFLFAVASSSVFAQSTTSGLTATIAEASPSFYTLISQAESAYLIESYEESAMLYERAFTLQTPTAQQLYDAACSRAVIGHTDLAFQHLQSAVRGGWIDLERLQEDSDLRPLHDDARWASLLENLTQRVHQWEAAANPSYRSELEALDEADQQYRRLIDSVETATGRYSEAWSTLMTQIEQNDQQNVDKVVALLDAHGWPTAEQTGPQASAIVCRLLTRAPLEIQTKYLSTLRSAARHGDATWQQLAEMEDLILVQQGKPQLYGSQYAFNPQTRQFEVLPIQKEHKVDRRRESMGLPPLDEFLQSLQASYTRREMISVIAD
ncbi:hypothetical protein SAMN05421823_101198 [Catalinimonas alkaloidigena]|uniref:Tetratricopeptide repeat-containing protein n=1 Tax=Catalinimonas alkaloidigena TaxID=1075417 RepID=A0A1G8WW35_9BACT|nr:DUF6624 domain-containing protein [Catalinimonas alkaloidigena]SDJ82393.1 hypothetical protein SAMN05421823_101198 [Catalinimonas alkaloidigena]